MSRGVPRPAAETVTDSDERDEEFVDRQTFLDEVGIHGATLGRWIREGVVAEHRMLRNSRWIQVFKRSDVHFAKAVRSVQKQRHGELSLRQVVAIVRGEMDMPPLGHDPSGRHSSDPP